MSDEDPYRIALLATFVPLMGIGIYHRLQAGKSREPISRKDEGLLLAVLLRLGGLGVWVGSIAYVISPQSMAWSQLPLPAWLRWCGLPLGILGSVMMYWTLSNLGKNLTDTVVTRINATLVTSGPYRFVRHPFYVCAALFVLSITLLSASWFLGLCGLLVIGALATRTPIEEQKLIEKFGDDYRAYMARTPRYFPRVFGKPSHLS